MTENELVGLHLPGFAVLDPLHFHTHRFPVLRAAPIQRLPSASFLSESHEDLFELVVHALDRGPLNFEPAEPRKLDFRSHIEGDRESEVTIRFVLDVCRPHPRKWG